jgi:hypothetical protein
VREGKKNSSRKENRARESIIDEVGARKKNERDSDLRNQCPRELVPMRDKH